MQILGHESQRLTLVVRRWTVIEANQGVDIFLIRVTVKRVVIGQVNSPSKRGNERQAALLVLIPSSSLVSLLLFRKTLSPFYSHLTILLRETNQEAALNPSKWDNAVESLKTRNILRERNGRSAQTSRSHGLFSS
jgi:hypothetical protein